MVDFIAASPLRRNLKLRDEDGIVSILDTELFENLTLMGYNISQNQKFTFQKGQFSHQWKYLIHTIMQCLSPESTWFNEFSSNITTALVCLATNRTYNFSKMIFDGMVKNEVEILRLKERVQVLEDRESVAAKQSRDDAPIKRRSINEGEATAKRINDDSEELARVLTSMDVATVLAGGIDVPTGSGSIPTAGPPATDISTSSEVASTASLIVTSYSRRKGKEVMVESDTPKKQRFQEQIDAQENYSKVYKFQSQQRRPMTKKQKRDYYMAMIKNNLGWKVKDFKGMTFEEIEAKFAAVWKLAEDFIPMGSKEEAERLKRKGLNLEQEHVKKQKTSEEAPEIEKSTEEKMKEMMQLVPVEDVYVQALQVKHLIIDCKVYTEGQRSYWKIIWLGGSSACYQFFIDLLKQLDREDLNQL
nr:hypothetical protein [Tanacetum cinerariifolium]